MDVALGMLAQIVEQRVGAHKRLVEVQIELAVVEQQSEGALVAVELPFLLPRRRGQFWQRRARCCKGR